MKNLPVTIPELFTPIPPAPIYTGPHVPDLPCPKCGSPDVALTYIDADHNAVQCSRRGCTLFGVGEHFHRGDRRCGYTWATNDVLPPDATVLPVRADAGGPQVGTATTGVDEAGNTTVTARIDDSAMADMLRRGVMDRYSTRRKGKGTDG